MNCKTIKLAFFILLCLVLAPLSASSEIYLEDDFEYADQAAWESSDWSVDSLAALQSSGGADGGGKCWYQEYNDSGTYWTSLPVNDTWPEGYIRFYAKLTNKQSSWPKFLKFFGTGCCDSAYSNWTMGTASYSSATLDRISHGGSNGSGDSQCVVKWSDGSVGCTGTMDSYSGDSFSWPDENWHKFIIYWKLNTNGSADGAFKVWIDGTLEMDVSGVVNRNDSNTRSFQKISFGDYTASAPASSYYLWYDELVIASTYDEADTGSASEDTTAPEISGTPSIGSDGETVSIGFSETVVTTGYTAGDFDLDCSSSGNDIALSSPSGSGSSWDFTAASTIDSGESCNLDFNGATGSIEDSAGNDLASFSNTSVTNNSTQGTATASGSVSIGSGSGSMGLGSGTGSMTIGGE